jgi:hypothetical protein
VNQSAPCRKILRRAEESFESMNKDISQGQINHTLLRSSCLLPDDSAGKIARELWWTNQGFSSVDIIPAHISPGGMNNRSVVAAVQRHSLNPPT